MKTFYILLYLSIIFVLGIGTGWLAHIIKYSTRTEPEWVNFGKEDTVVGIAPVDLPTGINTVHLIVPEVLPVTKQIMGVVREEYSQDNEEAVMYEIDRLIRKYQKP